MENLLTEVMAEHLRSRAMSPRSTVIHTDRHRQL